MKNKIKTGLFITLGIVAISFILFSEWLIPQWHGSHSLGKGLYMMEWDSPGRIIVLGTNIQGRACYGGSLLIPTYEDEYDSLGHFSEWVIDAVSNDKWLIAYTYNTYINDHKYYIIDKSFDENTDATTIIKKYRYVYFNRDSFNLVREQKGIMLDIDLNK